MVEESHREKGRKESSRTAVVEIRFVSVACSYQCTSKPTITNVSFSLSSSVASTIFLNLSSSSLYASSLLLCLSLSSLPTPPPQLPTAHLHAAIGGCTEGDSDSGGGVKNGGC